ncbi:hypothetical protein ACQKOE_06660 [Novosphingobium sp. NPDC080210]|jgi:hypothetical protein|uniref:hypothetical protein n=1 Tax=Novosphingobium sp. NPDC080210 TaxID=3390596 RepID=UPI003CFF5CCA
MDKATTQFDWIGWLSTVPGIPAGWGEAPAGTSPATAVVQFEPCAEAAARAMDAMPERKAA